MFTYTFHLLQIKIVLQCSIPHYQNCYMVDEKKKWHFLKYFDSTMVVLYFLYNIIFNILQ